jgi:hypothetical protein
MLHECRTNVTSYLSIYVKANKKFEENMQRYPRDNCQQYGHWKYMPECPNFHLYLASQEVVLEAFKNGAAGGASAGVDPTAVVPFTGSGMIHANNIKDRIS